MQGGKPSHGVLLTGASGYLGGLIAASLLTDEAVTLVLPVRRAHDLESVIAPIRAEIEIQGGQFQPEYLDRIHLVNLPPFESLNELDTVVRQHQVSEIIHCAGCVDYFDRPMLEAVNVGLTGQLLERAREWAVERFIYISTAFSSGYVDGVIEERQHGDPTKDPTDYTRTKREAERLVASSGLPYQIIRPSIVIGDSRDGHYSGKQYGLYQLWSGIERLLCRTWHPEIHAFAPRQRVSFLHQDAFQQGFLAAYRMLPDNSILNLVSDYNELPELRQLWDMWLADCMRPRAAYYYEKFADIPLREINTRQRAFLALASVNLEIASHPWKFETTNLDWLRQRGLQIPCVTLASVATCQRRFIEESARIQGFLAENRAQFASHIEIIDVLAEASFKESLQTDMISV